MAKKKNTGPIYNVECRHYQYGMTTRGAINHPEDSYLKFMDEVKRYMPYITVYRKAGPGKRNYKIQEWKGGELIWERKDK